MKIGFPMSGLQTTPTLNQQRVDSRFQNTADSFLQGEELEDKVLELKRISDSSIRVYKSSLLLLKTHLKEKGVTLITEEDIVGFEQSLKNKNFSVFTVISHLSAIKSFFSTLATRGLYPNVAENVRVPKKPKGFMRDTLTKIQAQALLKSALGESVIEKRNFAVLNILVRCGLRSIEIERADVGDVRYQNGVSVLYVHGKGRDSKDEFVVLTEESLATINAYLELRSNVKKQDPLFGSHGNRGDKKRSGRFQTRSIRRMVKHHLIKIGLNNTRLTCHSLRHTFATLALENNAPLLAVQKAMRHANINTTTIYTHMLDRLTGGAESYIDLDPD